jgi:hypothetical protein
MMPVADTHGPSGSNGRVFHNAQKLQAKLSFHVPGVSEKPRWERAAVMIRQKQRG